MVASLSSPRPSCSGPGQQPAAQLVPPDLKVDDRLQFDAFDLAGHPVGLLGLA